jgi:hypothetical protein
MSAPCTRHHHHHPSSSLCFYSHSDTKPMHRKLRNIRYTRTKAQRQRQTDDEEDEATIKFMCEEYGKPWIENEESAMKCLIYLREKEKRQFSLSKAKKVIAQLKENHYRPLVTAESKERNPFKMPKTFPGFLGILERSSDKIS